jgi:uncharacterized protein
VSLSAWLFAVSIVASALGGALGMASGIFIVPVLTLFGGLGFRTAVAASIVSVIACSSASAAPFLRNGVTNLRLALVLEVATTLGALTGVLLTGSLPVPVLRVILMGLAFYRQRDLPFRALALCVLTIITLAAFLGMQLRQ